MLSHEELIKNTDLCLNYFWILFQSGNIEQAESLIYLLQNHTTDKAELAMVHVCINNLKILTGDVESAFNYSELELQHINEDVDYWNMLAFLSLGEAHRLRFELTKSFKSFVKAAERAAASQLIYFEMVNRIRSSFALWTLGDFYGSYKESKDLLVKLNAAGANSSFSIDLLSSILYCKVGNFLININQIEDGLQKSVRGYDLSKKTTNQLIITSCTYLLAEAYYLAGEYDKAISLVEELDAIPYKQANKFLCILSDSLKCKLYLLTNKEELLQSLFKKEIGEDNNHKFERIVYSISKARYQIAQGKILEATDLLQKVAEELKAEKALGLHAEVELLQSKAFSLMQEEDKAIDYLLNAVLKTQSAGLIRFYINEGTEIETLLRKIKQTVSIKSSTQYNKVNIEYLNRLLRAFEKEKKVSAITLNDALSGRELDTLKLIAENLTNQEIADALYISITTVKTHVRNILLKLEAKNRNEAVSIAKEKGVLH
jgi:LuxR family maltose regulon positive regulatory protein